MCVDLATIYMLIGAFSGVVVRRHCKVFVRDTNGFRFVLMIFFLWKVIDFCFVGVSARNYRKNARFRNVLEIISSEFGNWHVL